MADISLLMLALCESVANKTPLAVNRFCVPLGMATNTSQSSAAVSTASQSILATGTDNPNVVSVR